MDKLTMAHDYFLRIISNPSVTLRAEDLHSIQYNAWVYADAMQAEAEKREDKTRPAVLNMADSPQLEWQPDWSQAPEWAVAWTIDSGEILWWSYKPELKNGYWFVEDSVVWQCAEAPTFGFTGTHIVERPHGF